MPIAVDEAGRFSASVPLSPTYLLKVTGPHIFPVVQTFGGKELLGADAATDGATNTGTNTGTNTAANIPTIELVARKKGRISLFFAGDSMAGRRFFKAGSREKPVLNAATIDSDLDALFAPMKPYIEASDYASLNLESIISAHEPAEASPKKFVFYSPPQLAGAMKRAGIDYVSLGNNHTADYGDEGLITTIAALDGAGIAWSGAGMNQQQAEGAARVTVQGTPLSLLGFVGWRGTWEPNQVATPDKSGAAWASKAAITRSLRGEVKADHIPIFQLHGSAEYGEEPSATTLGRLKLAIDEGAPAAIGHHPHVVHGLATYKDSLMASSLGNFLFDQTRPQTQVSYVLQVWLQDGEFLRAEAVPIQLLDYRPVPATDGMRRAALSRLAWLSAKNDTALEQSGGHLVLWADDAKVSRDCVARPSLALAEFARVCAGSEMHDYGRNLTLRGDFESALVGPAEDQFWQLRNADHQFYRDEAGEGMMIVQPSASGRGAFLYSGSYLREVEGTRFTLKLRVKAPRAMTAELRIKPRPRAGDPASPSVRGIMVGSRELAGAGWHEVEFDFTLDAEILDDGTLAKAARAFRPIVRFEIPRKEGEAREDVPSFAVDDFALIEWASDTAANDPDQAWRWTDIRPKQILGADLGLKTAPNAGR
jgi:poly-gamma-glutamate capsule biosynthesis protein CapA/YwtB (metallophosphatase superfamily)